MSSEQFAASHPTGIGRDFWHVARNRILWRRLQRTLGPRSRVMDVGCGPGIVVDFLRRQGVACFGADLGTPTPESSDVAPFLFLGQSAFELELRQREGIDTLLLMDVLEHLPEPVGFLKQCLQAFPDASVVHITVPARMEIWSNYDEYFGHFRRYDRPLVARLAVDAGLELVDSAYAFHGLYAVAGLLKLAARKRNTQLAAPRAPALHAVLGGLFDLEQRLVPTSLPGASIFAQLRRRA